MNLSIEIYLNQYTFCKKLLYIDNCYYQYRSDPGANRTRDTLIKSQVLYRLSYRIIKVSSVISYNKKNNFYFDLQLELIKRFHACQSRLPMSSSKDRRSLLALRQISS